MITLETFALNLEMVELVRWLACYVTSPCFRKTIFFQCIVDTYKRANYKATNIFVTPLLSTSQKTHFLVWNSQNLTIAKYIVAGTFFVLPFLAFLWESMECFPFRIFAFFTFLVNTILSKASWLNHTCLVETHFWKDCSPIQLHPYSAPSIISLQAISNSYDITLLCA